MPFKIAQLAVIVLSLMAVNEQTRSFLEFHKLVITAVAAYGAFLSFRQKRTGWASAMIAIAIVFNPILPVRQSKDAWRYADLLSASFIFCSMFAAANKDIKFPVVVSAIAAFMLLSNKTSLVPEPAAMSQGAPASDSVSLDVDKTISDAALTELSKKDAAELSLPATTDTESLVPSADVTGVDVGELTVPPPPVIPPSNSLYSVVSQNQESSRIVAPEPVAEVAPVVLKSEISSSTTLAPDAIVPQTFEVRSSGPLSTSARILAPSKSEAPAVVVEEESEVSETEQD